MGIFIAARAQGSTLVQVLTRMVRIPIMYALLLAGLVRLGFLLAASPVLKATLLLSQGAVPLILLILGIQLASVKFAGPGA